MGTISVGTGTKSSTRKGKRLWKKMWSDDLHEFAGTNDPGLVRKGGEVAGIAGDEIVGAGGVSAFEKDVVGGIGRDLERMERNDEARAAGDELKKARAQALADRKFRACKHGAIFGKNWRRDKETGGLGESEKENGWL